MILATKKIEFLCVDLIGLFMFAIQKYCKTFVLVKNLASKKKNYKSFIMIKLTPIKCVILHFNENIAQITNYLNITFQM